MFLVNRKSAPSDKRMLCQLHTITQGICNPSMVASLASSLNILLVPQNAPKHFHNTCLSRALVVVLPELLYIYRAAMHAKTIDTL